MENLSESTKGNNANTLLCADWRSLKDSKTPMTPTQWSKDVLLVNAEGKQWVDTLFYSTGEPIPLFWLSRRTDATHWLPLPVPPICT